MSKQKDKTCVPVVPQATEEQRETLHQKAIGKHIETHVEYELMLRFSGHDTELVLDVREDTVDSDGEPMGEEYVEGFVYDHWSLKKNYGDAVTKLLELKEKYPDACVTDDILEDAEALLAIRYGKGSWQVDKDGREVYFGYDPNRFGCRVDR